MGHALSDNTRRPAILALLLCLLWFGALPVFSLPRTGPDRAKVEAEVYRELSRYVPRIEELCGELEVDPFAVYAILYIEKMQYELDSLRSAKKSAQEFLQGLPALHDSLTVWAGLSSGYAHIKPDFAVVTFQRMENIPEHAGFLTPRDIEVLYYSSRPEAALRIMVAGLYLLNREWEEAPEGISLRNRPEILGTLYNLGYEHSLPHPHPLPGGSTLPVIIDGELVKNLPFGYKILRLREHSEAMAGFLKNRFRDGGTPEYPGDS